MKTNASNLYYILGFIMKVLLSLFFTNIYIAVFYALITTIIYFMMSKSFKTGIFISFMMLDFINAFHLTGNWELNINHVLVSTLYFIAINSITLINMANDISKATSFTVMKKDSNEKIDLGIKALEKENYDEAVIMFEEAIKTHKYNYLGYMGMCNTLIKMNKRDVKEFEIYKKKCLKYAPKQLKEDISKKYFN